MANLKGYDSSTLMPIVDVVGSDEPALVGDDCITSYFTNSEVIYPQNKQTLLDT